MIILIIVVFAGALATAMILGLDQLSQETKEEKRREEIRNVISKEDKEIL